MPDGPDEISPEEFKDGGIALDTEFDEQAEELLELEAELSSVPGAEMDPDEQYEAGMVVGAERVGVTDVPNTYPASFRSPNVLRLDVQLNPNRRTSVYLDWPDQLTGETPLDRLLSIVDVPAHSFADVLGREIPVQRDGSHYVVDLDGSTAHEPRQAMDRPTTTSDDSDTTSPYWFYLVVGCYASWLGVILSIALIDHLLPDLFQGVVIFLAWVFLPIGTYYDSKHIGASSDWSPNKWIWSAVSFVWYLNIPLMLVYLFKRHQAAFHRKQSFGRSHHLLDKIKSKFD